MAEHACTRFFSSAFGDLVRDHVADSAQSKFAAFDIAFNLLAIFWARALGNNHQGAEAAGRFASFYRIRDFVVIERDLRNQDDVRATGDTSVKRDPSGVAPHYFDNHHSFVTR